MQSKVDRLPNTCSLFMSTHQIKDDKMNYELTGSPNKKII